MKPIVEVHHLSKKFRIGHQPGYQSMRERMLQTFQFRSNNTEEFWALNNISFDILAGESIGIIGRNGAGKSTLLKILSRITPPTLGKIITRGRIASLLEVGTGFHYELTGRENIFFNGSLLGMKKKEIQTRFDEIVAFSGAEKFLDTALKHYSSGMVLRLAFSVAAFLEPEIMIIDEVLAVGDAEFQKKCLGKMEDVSKSGRTILFVSHDLNAISNLSKKVMVIKNGDISFFGNTLEGISAYQADFRKSETFSVDAGRMKKSVYFKNIRVCSQAGDPQSSFLFDQPLMIEFAIGINDPSVRCDLFVMILDSRKRRVFALESNQLKSEMKVVIEPETLVRGTYSVTAFINQPNIARIDEVDDVCSFEVIDNGSQMLKHGNYDYGNVFGRGKWID